MRYHLRYVIVDTEFPGIDGEVVVSEPMMHSEAAEKQELLNRPVIEGTARGIKPGEPEPEVAADPPTYGVDVGYGPGWPE